jgi:hypothetical protein
VSAGGRPLAVLALLGVVLGGCQTMTGRSMGQWVDDRTITARVKARLAAERPLHLTRVHVDTYEATVYLTGIVRHAAARERIARLVAGVPGVRQVVTNLEAEDHEVGAASPATAAPVPPHPLLALLPGLARIDGAAPGPYTAFDHEGHAVATVFTVDMRELSERGFEQRVPAGRPVDHVAIYPVAGVPDVPVAQYHVVLWHVSRSEEARLR